MYNTKKANDKTYFIVDFFNEKIIGTKTSFDKASKGISPYYQQLTFLMKEHPSFKPVVKEQKKKPAKSKRTYEGLDFKFMEDYISIQKNSAVLLREFKSVKAYAEGLGKSTYPILKKWFLGEFDPEGEGFDMDEAKKAISQAGIDGAVIEAHENNSSTLDVA